MATLLIVDDHEIIRKGIKSVLSTHPEVDDIHEAGNGSDAYQLMNNQVFLTSQEDDADETFAEMVVVGTSGSGIEMGMEAAHLALSEPLYPFALE